MNPERYATRDDMMATIKANMAAIQANRENTMVEVRAIEKSLVAQREETLALIAATDAQTKEQIAATKEQIAATKEQIAATDAQTKEQIAAASAQTKEQIAANREESKEALHKMEMSLVRVEMSMVRAVADVRCEMRSIGRQYWITLAALLTSICIAVACNLPGHWKNWKNLSQAQHGPYRAVQRPTGRLARAEAECPVCWLRQHTMVARQQVQSAH
ncbi:MAG: hypothetical protein OXC07_05440, partial [Kistimonas sp.]|nr:hypothetical protein [Kistimonas sp.]